MFLIIDHLKRLEFLDLEYSAKNKVKISVENFKFNCSFEKGFNHILHSENNHLNSLTDLVLNLGVKARVKYIIKQKIKNPDIRIITANIEYSPLDKEEFRKQIPEMLNQKLIRRSKSPHRTAAFMVSSFLYKSL